jgi:hypothetical protein
MPDNPVWTTRSRIVGMPSGRSRPSGFGMDTRHLLHGPVLHAFHCASCSSSSRLPGPRLHFPSYSRDANKLLVS